MTPFSGKLAQLAAQHERAAVPVELIPEPLRPLIARGMAKDPAARPPDAAAFVAELEATAAAAYGAGWEARGRAQLAAGAAALLMLVPGAVGAATATGAGSGTATTTTWLGAVKSAIAAHAFLYLGIGAAVIAVLGGGLVAISRATAHQAQPTTGATPAEASLLAASGMPYGTAPVPVPGGYEAAAWADNGRVTFWKWPSASPAWHEIGASTYPVLPPNFGTSHSTITGALLAGMTDATFIAHGQYTGDGTGSYIAFTSGSRGWGTVAPGPGNTMVATGRKSTDNATPGNSYTELFRGGDLEMSEPGFLPFGPNGEEWQIERVYAWSAGTFRQVSTTQFTAAPGTPLPATATGFPTTGCQGLPSGTYKDFAVQATPAFPRYTPGGPPVAYVPTSVELRFYADGPFPTCDFRVAPDFPVVISAATGTGTAWITAPAWALTRGTPNPNLTGPADIGELLPGIQFPGSSGEGTLDFQDPHYSPYYIPKNLGILQVGQLASPVARVQDGRLTALTVLPTT
jgi:hypothetical protein